MRKATLASVLRSCLPGVQFNQHLAHPGDVVFQHACKMGLEGIVSKRLGSLLRAIADWLKSKNPAAPAVKREAEGEWGKDKKPRQADGAKVTLQRRPSVLKAKGSPISL